MSVKEIEELLRTETSTPLTNADRCDRCGSRAYVRAVINNTPLHFCRHHGNQHMLSLVEFTHDIYVEPLSSP